jgi:hypothetical protein
MSAQLAICVLACESPFDPSFGGVALLLPLSDSSLQLRRGSCETHPKRLDPLLTIATWSALF